MRQTNAVVIMAALAAASSFAALMSEPAFADGPPRPIGSGLQLFVDDWLIANMKGAALRLHEPVPREAVFTFDAKWEGSQSGYVAILRDGDAIRMYYRGGGDLVREYTCLAESKDGIRWTRPSLRLMEFDGSKDNNILWTGKRKAYDESHNFSPFLDENPAAPPDQRYKALTLARSYDARGERKNVLVAFVSADGIRWKRLREEPVITEGSFDSQNIAFWDRIQARYVCYSRMTQQGKRSISRCTSADFLQWTKPQLLDFGGTPIEHFYTNAITPYFRAPHLYIGLPMRFVPPSERNHVGAERRETDGLSDAVFMASRDGLRWSRTFLEAFIRPGADPLNWGGAHGNQTPAWGILQTGPTEMSVYWSEHYDNYPKTNTIPFLRRGTLRLDGFVSVHAGYSGGEMTTRPLQFKGKRLVINYSTSAVGGVKVEVQDEGGKPIPGFALNDSIEIWGDEIERTVAWKGGHDVSRLSGRPVRLRFVMKDADLYSIRFAADAPS